MTQSSDSVFDMIANDLALQGFCILQDALPPDLLAALIVESQQSARLSYRRAGIGRLLAHQTNLDIRSDKIAWIDSTTPAGNQWLIWSAELQRVLNQRLFLGLFSFESHYAHYMPGAFYERHVDAFRGRSNRLLSLVTYLNEQWEDSSGGELALYQNVDDLVGLRVQPKAGTVVVFLSDEFPHEVLPATRDRYSIAGWFRINSSTGDFVDPPS